MRTQHNKLCLLLWKKHIIFKDILSDSVPSSPVTQEIMATNSVQKGLLFVCCQKTKNKSRIFRRQAWKKDLYHSILIFATHSSFNPLSTRSEFLCQLDFYVELACDFLLSLSNSKYFWPDTINTGLSQFCFIVFIVSFV